MNWKQILILSSLGLLMSFVTVYWVSAKVEPFLWLIVFFYSAYRLVSNIEKRSFLHGFYLGLINCVWMTVIHIALSGTYLSNHPKEAAQFLKLQSQTGATITTWVLLTNITAGILSALVLGLFTLMAAAYIKRLS